MEKNNENSTDKSIEGSNENPKNDVYQFSGGQKGQMNMNQIPVSSTVAALNQQGMIAQHGAEFVKQFQQNQLRMIPPSQDSMNFDMFKQLLNEKFEGVKEQMGGMQGRMEEQMGGMQGRMEDGFQKQEKMMNDMNEKIEGEMSILHSGLDEKISKTNKDVEDLRRDYERLQMQVQTTQDLIDMNGDKISVENVNKMIIRAMSEKHVDQMEKVVEKNKEETEKYYQDTRMEVEKLAGNVAKATEMLKKEEYNKNANVYKYEERVQKADEMMNLIQKKIKDLSMIKDPLGAGGATGSRGRTPTKADFRNYEGRHQSEPPKGRPGGYTELQEQFFQKLIRRTVRTLVMMGSTDTELDVGTMNPFSREAAALAAARTLARALKDFKEMDRKIAEEELNSLLLSKMEWGRVIREGTMEDGIPVKKGRIVMRFKTTKDYNDIYSWRLQLGWTEGERIKFDVYVPKYFYGRYISLRCHKDFLFDHRNIRFTLLEYQGENLILKVGHKQWSSNLGRNKTTYVKEPTPLIPDLKEFAMNEIANYKIDPVTLKIIDGEEVHQRQVEDLERTGHKRRAQENMDGETSRKSQRIEKAPSAWANPTLEKLMQTCKERAAKDLVRGDEDTVAMDTHAILYKGKRGPGTGSPGPKRTLQSMKMAAIKHMTKKGRKFVHQSQPVIYEYKDERTQVVMKFQAGLTVLMFETLKNLKQGVHFRSGGIEWTITDIDDKVRDSRGQCTTLKFNVARMSRFAKPANATGHLYLGTGRMLLQSKDRVEPEKHSTLSEFIAHNLIQNIVSDVQLMYPEEIKRINEAVIEANGDNMKIYQERQTKEKLKNERKLQRKKEAEEKREANEEYKLNNEGFEMATKAAKKKVVTKTTKEKEEVETVQVHNRFMALVEQGIKEANEEWSPGKAIIREIDDLTEEMGGNGEDQSIVIEGIRRNVEPKESKGTETRTVRMVTDEEAEFQLEMEADEAEMEELLGESPFVSRKKKQRTPTPDKEYRDHLRAERREDKLIAGMKKTPEERNLVRIYYEMQDENKAAGDERDALLELLRKKEKALIKMKRRPEASLSSLEIRKLQRYEKDLKEICFRVAQVVADREERVIDMDKKRNDIIQMINRRQFREGSGKKCPMTMEAVKLLYPKPGPFDITESPTRPPRRTLNFATTPTGGEDERLRPNFFGKPRITSRIENDHPQSSSYL